MSILATILIYVVLPVVVILGTMFFIRRKREDEAGLKHSNSIKSIKEEGVEQQKATSHRTKT